MSFSSSRETASVSNLQKFFAELFFKKATAFFFLLCALPTGLGLALLTPIGEVPDEPAHITRADGLLYGDILGHAARYSPPRGGQVEILSGVTNNLSVASAAVAELWPTFPTKPLPAAAKAAARAITWDSRTGFQPCNMDEYMPAFYLPAAFGIAFGRLAGVAPLDALFAGRLAMLLAYLAMGFAALRLARFGQPLLFALLLLPMSLCLAASFNLDGQLIGATVLAAALLTRGGARARWGALALLALVVASKPPYLPLLLMAALPLGAAGLRRRLAAVSAFALAPLLWVLLMFRYSYAVWYRPAYHPGPLWPGSPARLFTSTSVRENLHVLLSHPAALVRLPLNFLVTDWHGLWRTILGVFGWGPIQLAAWQYDGWAVALGAACLACLAQGRRRVAPVDAVAILLLLFTAMLAMELSLYLTWTNIGQASIDGINGRYFLLFPPFLALLLPGISRRPGLAAALALPAVVMAVLDLPLLPALMLHIYKMGWP